MATRPKQESTNQTRNDFIEVGSQVLDTVNIILRSLRKEREGWTVYSASSQGADSEALEAELKNSREKICWNLLL